MSRPIIAVTAGRHSVGKRPSESQDASVGSGVQYVDAVLLSGGAPVLLPPTDDREAIAAVICRVDALLLSGGGDVDPLSYGEEPHPTCARQDPVRDRMEFEAVRLAMGARLPILGICRGIQVLNVALGGTLIQDVPSQVSGAVEHAPKKVHAIAIEPGSLLARVLGTRALEVNSRHHQAVKDVAAGLRVNARGPDGVIEGLEADDGRPILAVQCHPETVAAQYPIFQKIFDWIVAEAIGRPRS